MADEVPFRFCKNNNNGKTYAYFLPQELVYYKLSLGGKDNFGQFTVFDSKGNRIRVPLSSLIISEDKTFKNKMFVNLTSFENNFSLCDEDTFNKGKNKVINDSNNK